MNACYPKFGNEKVQKSLEAYIFRRNAFEVFVKRNEATGELEFIRIVVNGITYEFERTKFLGRGNFGQVFLIEDKVNGLAFAVKETESIRESEVTKKLWDYDCHVLKSLSLSEIEGDFWLNHPSLRRKHLFLMELADDNLFSLAQKQAALDPQIALQIAEEIRRQLLCLYELYSDETSSKHHFVYCDMKLENILYKCETKDDFTNMRVFLGDLESAVPEVNTEHQLYVYTTTFLPQPLPYIPIDVAFQEPMLKLKEAILSASLGILLLSLSSFFYAKYNDVEYMLMHYGVSDWYANHLASHPRGVLDHALIRNYLRDAYAFVAQGSDFGLYLLEDYKARPSIHTPLTMSTNAPISFTLYAYDFSNEQMEKLKNELIVFYQEVEYLNNHVKDILAKISTETNPALVQNVFQNIVQQLERYVTQKKEKAKSIYVFLQSNVDPSASEYLDFVKKTYDDIAFQEFELLESVSHFESTRSDLLRPELLTQPGMPLLENPALLPAEEALAPVVPEPVEEALAPVVPVAPAEEALAPEPAKPVVAPLLKTSGPQPNILVPRRKTKSKVSTEQRRITFEPEPVIITIPSSEAEKTQEEPNVVITSDKHTLETGFELVTKNLMQYRKLSITQFYDKTPSVSLQALPLLSDMIVRFIKKDIPLFLQGPLAFGFYQDPELLGIVQSDVTQAENSTSSQRVLTNAIFLAMSWQSYTTKNGELLEKITNTVAEVKNLGSLVPRLLQQVYSLLPNEVKTFLSNVPKDSLAYNVHERVFFLNKAYTELQKVLYMCMVLKKTPKTLPKLQQLIQKNGLDEKKWTQCLATKLKYSTDFLSTCHTIDVYVLLHYKCWKLKQTGYEVPFLNNTSFTCSMLEHGVEQTLVDLVEPVKNNTLQFVRCLFWTNTQLSLLSSIVAQTKTLTGEAKLNSKQDATTLRKAIVRFCQVNREVGFDYHVVLSQAKWLFKSIK